MITEDDLSTLLASLAESEPVPPNGARNALLQIRRVEAGTATAPPRAAPFSGRRFVVALGAVAALALGVTVVATHHTTTQSAGTTAASAPAAGAAVPDSSGLTGGAVAASPAPMAASAGAGADTGSAGTSAGTTTTSGANKSAQVPNVDTDPDKVVRTGTANLTVAKGGVAKAVNQLQADAKGLGGSVQDENTDSDSATVTLSVPVAQFDALVKELAAVGTVASQQSTSKDVTGTYVDLGARIKALETSRDTYLTILSQAKTVNDTLSVQQRLDDIQSQIEQLQGQQNELGQQAAFSTLAVTVNEKSVPPPPVKPAPTQSGLSLAFHHAWDHFRNGTEDVISASGTVALLLIAALVLWVAYKVGRTAYRRRTV